MQRDMGKGSSTCGIGMLRRAVLYLTRLKKKNLLLLAVMFLLISLFMGGIAVDNGIQNSVETIYQGMEGYFQVGSDNPAYQIDDSFIDQVMEEDTIVRYNATNVLYLSVPDTVLIPGRFLGSGAAEEHMTRFISNSRSNDCEYFSNKQFELIEGEPIGDAKTNTAIISDTLASLNNYTIGDTITANIVKSSLLLFDSEAEGKAYDFRIAGIYRSNYEQKVGADTAECNIEDNYIFIDSNSGKEIASYLQGNKRNTYTGVQFFLASPREIDETISRLTEKDVLEGRDIHVMNHTYEQSEEQLQTMSRLTRTYLWILGIAGTLVLFGVMQIHLRDRRREIAIFLSLGVKKSNIILQHMIENMILYMFSWIAAVAFVSTLIFAVNRILTDIQLSMSVTEACLSGLIGLFAVLTATLTSHVYIARFSPGHILSTFS